MILYSDTINVNISKSVFQDNITVVGLLRRIIGGIEKSHHITVVYHLEETELHDGPSNNSEEAPSIIHFSYRICYTVSFKHDITLNHFKLKYPDLAGAISSPYTFKKFLEYQISLECSLNYGVYYAPYVPMIKKTMPKL